jgi:hypothetical protein
MAVSAVLYRAGGMGKESTAEPTWIPAWMRNTKTRDLGCPLVSFLYVMFVINIGAPWWAHFAAFGLMFGALTTYWDSLFGFDNFWFHGFMIGLAYFPYAIADYHLWWIVGVRALVLAVLMGAWSAIVKKDYVEEGGRGASIPLSNLLFLLK